MKPDFEGFTVVDFPPPKGSIPGPSDGFVYVFFWIESGAEVAFYVGQTRRLSGRMDDYRLANFTALTDFRAGEAARYLIGAKKYRIIVRYKPSVKPKEDEKKLIRELQLSGVRLLNGFPSYDYPYANEAEERDAVQRFCDMLIRMYKSDSGAG